MSVIMTLPLTLRQQIHRETVRLNVRTWRLHPWERTGKKGFVRLCGLIGDGKEYLIARIPAKTLDEGERLYVAVNQYLASRADWKEIESSTQDDQVLTGDGVDWSRL